MVLINFIKPTKFLKFVCILLISLSLIACNEDKQKTEAVADGKIYNGALLQLRPTDTFDVMHKAFFEELDKKAYSGDKVHIDYRYADGDINKLDELAHEVAKAEYDFVLTVGTPATQALLKTKTKIPHFYMAVSNPYVIDLAINPDAPTTGTIMIIPISSIFRMVDTLNPDIKHFAIMHYDIESNTRITVNNSKMYLEVAGIKVTEVVVKDHADAVVQAKRLLEEGEVDAFFFPNGSPIQQDLPEISPLILAEKKPIYCAFDPANFYGCVATVTIEMEDVGMYTADLLVEYFNGKKIEDIPAKLLAQESRLHINKQLADYLGIEIPNYLDNIVYFESKF